MLKDKVVIITGGSQGIGAASVKKFSENGFRIVVSYKRSRKKAQELVDKYSSKKKQICAIEGDISNLEVQNKIVSTAKEMGQVHALINNAGEYNCSSINQLDIEHMRKSLEVNFIAPISLIKRCRKLLKKTSGSIINLSSINSIFPKANTLQYSCSKAALDAATRCLAAELACDGIRVNSIAPGPVDTTLLRSATDQSGIEFMKKITPLENRIATPHDISPIIYFLATPEARWLTGQVIVVDGGITL